VTWDVPQRLSVSSPRQVGQGSLFPKRQTPDVPVVDPSRLHTAYTIEPTKGKPPWVPLAVYDDGTKTVIKFKDNLGFTAAPAPFAMDSEGKINLVQFTPYSVPGEPDKGTYYIVQGLWPLLELRGDGGMVVTIKRQTGQPKPYEPTS
jgi:Conjugal transfer protein